MTDPIGVVYVEIKTKLFSSIDQDAIYEEKDIGQWQTDYMGVVYTEDDTESSWSIRPSVIYDKN